MISGFLKKLRITDCKLVFFRCLHLQEYQSKELLRDHGLAIQRFITVGSAHEAAEKFRHFKASEYVVKAQILAGGRGKGHFSSGLKGGVKLTRDQKEAVNWIKDMIGHNLVTKQTPTGGVKVQRVMIAEALDIARECYLAILMDRETTGPIIVASPEGGVDIEEVAKKSPQSIFKVPIDIVEGLKREKAIDLAKKLKFSGKLIDEVADQILRLYEMFLKVDATQIEINPFGETPDKRVVCFDAKFDFDDSAAFRQKKIFALDNHAEDDPREKEAMEHNLSFVGLDGNIACLVNGAGLAMATLDIVKLYGGEPANFLDVGGGVQEKQVIEAFRIITHDERIKVVFVNIFGGIVNCATIANGLTHAFKKIHLRVPLVVRLEGTNADAARKILKDSGLPIKTASDLDEAAKLAVNYARNL